MTFINSDTMTNKLMLLLNIISYINCIWPPEYKVKLKYEDEFIISELLDRSDVQDVYDEEELIRKEDLETLKLHENINSKRYYGLHGLSKVKNMKTRQGNPLFSKNYDTNLVQNFPEFNPDLDEPKPWIGGIVDLNNNIVKDEDTIYFDDEAKSNKTNNEKLEKRNAQNDTDNNENYNYENLKAQYDDSVKKADTKNDSLKYKEIKEEETPDEAVKTLVNLSAHNCSEEEKSGIGFGAVRCFIIESRNKHLNKEKKYYMFKKVFLLATIWLFVYLIIALPLWCQYGWCCCCCRCKFCHPRDEIEQIKTFFENNKPGVYHDDEGNVKKYKATTYEIYAQKNLEKAIQRL